MFERKHHLRIASILGVLDAQQLAANACYFGGGTAMALRYGEYRESADIDFLVSSVPGYRNLRQILKQPEGMQAIVRSGAVIHQARPVRTDQYGIRTLLTTGGTPIKFEIVLEGRIALDTPGKNDCIFGISTLTPLDMATSKLLANADRFLDDATLSRDLIDLAMMAPSKKLLAQAIQKASTAYPNIEADLVKSTCRLLDRSSHFERCMKDLRMTTPKALLRKRVKALLPRRQARQT